MVHLIAPDDLDPDDALETQWLREHDGAPGLEEPHREQIARELVLMFGHEVLLSDAWAIFDDRLYEMEMDDDDRPY